MRNRIPKACYAYPNGDLKSAEEFLKLAGNRYQERRIFPYCPECDERLSISNASNTDKKTYYRHYPSKDLDDNMIEACSLREKSSNRQGWYCTSFDFQRGKTIREKFLAKENLIKAYTFCGVLLNQKFTFAEFKEMLKLADRKKIWAYSDIQLWAIPYILLTLKDFEHTKGFGFHFVLHKQGNNNKPLSELLASQVEIEKVFSNSGKLMGKSPNNPYPISEESYVELLEKNSWKMQNIDFSEKLFRYFQVDQGTCHFHP